jgi:cysteine synthase A
MPDGPHDGKAPARSRGRIHDSILDTIGATPLVRAPNLARDAGLVADLALKLEFFNPLGSVKDRIGLAMVDAAEAEGRLTRGKSTLVEPTSGNTGIALAFVAAARGYRLIVVMPERASIERQKMLRLLGAEVVLTPPDQGMAAAISRAEAIVAATKGAVLLRQFDNPANPAIHARTTAEEIFADTDGEVAAIVGGIGTGGTLTGVACALKPRIKGLLVIGVEPAESAVLSGDEAGPHGIQGIGAGFVPAVLDRALLDEVATVSERAAVATARRVARLDGIPVGISSGAALSVALRVAARPELAGKLVIAIAPSFAERYLSTALFAGLE